MSTQEKTVDSAPRDGSDIFLFVPHLGWRPAFWSKGEWHSPVDEDTIYTRAAHWMPEPPIPASQRGT